MVAVFASADPDQLLIEAPLLTGPAGNAVVVTGMADDTLFHLQLGLQPTLPGDGAVEWLPVGSVLTVRTGAPIYVDASAPETGADGLTPGTAFPTLFLALLTAFTGERNVWVAGGDYPAVNLPAFASTHIYGGFGPDFDLATRDIDMHPTTLRAQAPQTMLAIQGETAAVVIDGLNFDGQLQATRGLDLLQTPLELRRVNVTDCAGPGVRLRSDETSDPVHVLINACSVQRNGAEGLALSGSFDLDVLGCQFALNVQEGVDLDDLFVADGRSTRVRFRLCDFLDNGTDGLDMDLSAPLVGGSMGGHFDVSIENCRFERNGSVGLIVDIEFDVHPLWDADIMIRGVTTRANLGNGLRLDLDARATVLVHRLLSSANHGHGLLNTAGLTPTLTVLSASALIGNGGAGLRLEDGLGSVAVSHGLVSANVAGGLSLGKGRASVTSSVAALQSSPWSSARTVDSVEITDGFQPLFLRAPLVFARAIAMVSGGVQLDAFDEAMIGQPLAELADDGQALGITGFGGAGNSTLFANPEPAPTSLPTLLAVFGPGLDVEEDYRLASGSAALQAGLAAPGRAPADAGPFGSPRGGPPGRKDAQQAALWSVAGLSPGMTQDVDANAPVRVAFRPAGVDPMSVDASSVVVRGPLGTVLSALFMEDAGDLVVLPPAGGWPAGVTTLELHAALRSVEGTPLAAPLILTITSP